MQLLDLANSTISAFDTLWELVEYAFEQGSAYFSLNGEPFRIGVKTRRACLLHDDKFIEDIRFAEGNPYETALVFARAIEKELGASAFDSNVNQPIDVVNKTMSVSQTLSMIFEKMDRRNGEVTRFNYAQVAFTVEYLSNEACRVIGEFRCNSLTDEYTIDAHPSVEDFRKSVTLIRQLLVEA